MPELLDAEDPDLWKDDQSMVTYLSEMMKRCPEEVKDLGDGFARAAWFFSFLFSIRFFSLFFLSDFVSSSFFPLVFFFLLFSSDFFSLSFLYIGPLKWVDEHAKEILDDLARICAVPRFL